MGLYGPNIEKYTYIYLAALNCYDIPRAPLTLHSTRASLNAYLVDSQPIRRVEYENTQSTVIVCHNCSVAAATQTPQSRRRSLQLHTGYI